MDVSKSSGGCSDREKGQRKNAELWKSEHRERTDRLVSIQFQYRFTVVYNKIGLDG